MLIQCPVCWKLLQTWMNSCASLWVPWAVTRSRGHWTVKAFDSFCLDDGLNWTRFLVIKKPELFHHVTWVVSPCYLSCFTMFPPLTVGIYEVHQFTSHDLLTWESSILVKYRHVRWQKTLERAIQKIVFFYILKISMVVTYYTQMCGIACGEEDSFWVFEFVQGKFKCMWIYHTLIVLEWWVSDGKNDLSGRFLSDAQMNLNRVLVEGQYIRLVKTYYIIIRKWYACRYHLSTKTAQYKKLSQP